ncbi:hypothetical protein N7520_009342 [Penicillium odoratum]|uniref:uncharacterized protein n=1 Tax=Penicillium odoratum TaxID=1167516 RepID=UPI0025473213|nr:uncharacterized protein N7520_009342 [Penicillium odoratum]KAJ5752425.1 hypothetical protein N7520_009342 [Penicillium odoratum]
MANGIFNSTYYGKDYRAGAALLRARRPYLFKNAFTGFGLVVFTIGVCMYRRYCPCLLLHSSCENKSHTVALVVTESFHPPPCGRDSTAYFPESPT